MGSLTLIAKMRPQFMGKVIAALETLHSKFEWNDNDNNNNDEDDSDSDYDDNNRNKKRKLFFQLDMKYF